MLRILSRLLLHLDFVPALLIKLFAGINSEQSYFDNCVSCLSISRVTYVSGLISNIQPFDT